MGNSATFDREYVERLKARFSDADTRETLSDKQLLTLLLSFADCKDELSRVSDSLWSHFGSIQRCFTAEYDDLARIPGMTHRAAMLMLIVGRIPALEAPSALIGKQVTDYCELFLSLIRSSNDEALWLAALDKDNRLLAASCLKSGVRNAVDIHIGKILEFVTYNKSKKLVIAHSHPDMSTAVASGADMIAMSCVGTAVGRLAVEFPGQVIVAGRKAKFFPYTPKLSGA